MDKRPLILIVEDDDPVAAMIEDFLATSNFRTARARDGREAVTRARELWPDLIVMDVMMPGLTGGEAANELRRDPLTNRIPILEMCIRDSGMTVMVRVSCFLSRSQRVVASHGCAIVDTCTASRRNLCTDATWNAAT